MTAFYFYLCFTGNSYVTEKTLCELRKWLVALFVFGDKMTASDELGFSTWAFTRQRDDKRQKMPPSFRSRIQSAWNLNLGLKDHLSPVSPEATEWNWAIIYFIIQTKFIVMKTFISKKWIYSNSLFFLQQPEITADPRRSLTSLKSACTLFVADVVPLPYLTIIRCFMSSNTPVWASHKTFCPAVG